MIKCLQETGLILREGGKYIKQREFGNFKEIYTFERPSSMRNINAACGLGCGLMAQEPAVSR